MRTIRVLGVDGTEKGLFTLGGRLVSGVPLVLSVLGMAVLKIPK